MKKKVVKIPENFQMAKYDNRPVECPLCGDLLWEHKDNCSEYYVCLRCETEWHWSEVHEAGDPLAAAL